MIQYVQALCIAVAKNDLARARELVGMVAAKMPPARRHVIDRWLAQSGEVKAVTFQGNKLKHWTVISEPRSPWVPLEIERAIRAWYTEVERADELVEAGERVLPLLLTGETRCGKTSSLCGIAAKLKLRTMRLTLAEAVGSHLGETAKAMNTALSELRSSPDGFWIIDEIDGIAPKRGNTDSGASQERAHAVGALLSELESLPPTIPLVATSNLLKTMDAAVLGRFNVVEFPKWADLKEHDRLAFATSHGCPMAAGASSYAEAVKQARAHRVEAILGKPKAEDLIDGDDDLPGSDEEVPATKPATREKPPRSETAEERQRWLAECRPPTTERNA